MSSPLVRLERPGPAPRLDPGDILTPKQLAERLQVGVKWVYDHAEKRDRPLPVLRCGRYLRFIWPDVCAWLRSGDSA